MTEYHCIEIWKENDKFYKKVYDDDHEKGGINVRITEEEFNKFKEMIGDEYEKS